MASSSSRSGLATGSSSAASRAVSPARCRKTNSPAAGKAAAPGAGTAPRRAAGMRSSQTHRSKWALVARAGNFHCESVPPNGASCAADAEREKPDELSIDCGTSPLQLICAAQIHGQGTKDPKNQRTEEPKRPRHSTLWFFGSSDLRFFPAASAGVTINVMGRDQSAQSAEVEQRGDRGHRL